MKLFKLAAALAVGVVALAGVTARAAEMTLNLKDAEITSLISTVSEFTGKNFIVDGRVKGKVTVISSSPMSPEGVYQTFLAVLQVNGFAAIPAGEAIKIVPETNARQDGGTRTATGRGLPMDEVVTHVYSLQNVSAAQLVPILRPLVPQWGHLAAYQPANMLIISDRAANVLRLEQLITQMDQTGDREITYVRLQNAGAAEVVKILTALTQQDKQADPSARPVTIIADERSNSVLLGGDKSERQKFIDIIGQLDIPLKDDGATQVVYLQYASAENLAPILEGYAQQATQTGKTGAPAGNAAPAAPSGGGLNDQVKVLADKDTNALIITAPPKAMRQVRDVIAQLDIRRNQVLVEAIIAEVSASKQSKLGVDWAVFNGERIAAAGIMTESLSSALNRAASAAGSTSTSSSNSALLANAALGLLSQGVTLGGGVINDDGTSFAVLLKALQGDGDTNVLSTPTLVTLDNQEAKFTAGQEVPFTTGQFSNTGTSQTSTTGVVNPFQTIERKDVGLTLGVTPQINAGGSTIKLKIDLEVSSIAAGTAGGTDLITNKRTLTNTVGVDDGQVLVIGGLIDDQLQDSHNGIPFISSIPLIGSFFQSRSVTKQKRNLMVFIRPSILRKQADGDYYTRLKYDSVRHAQITGAKGAVPLIGGQRPLLEPLEQYASEARPSSPMVVPNIHSPESPPGTEPAQPAPGTTPVPAPSSGSQLTPDEQTATPPPAGTERRAEESMPANTP